MRTLVLVHPRTVQAGGADGAERVDSGGVAMWTRMLEVDPPHFDSDLPENRSKVALDVWAFSCNYRDKVLATIYSSSEQPEPHVHFGSDFVAEVASVGRNVVGLRPGDRVINDNHYPGPRARGLLPGVPTNHASARRLHLHELKLMKIDDALPGEVAAAFSVCAQTSYAILRRLRPRPGERGLVTAATSGTSLAVLSALRGSQAEVYALSTGLPPDRDLSALGVAGTIRLRRPVQRVGEHQLVKRLARARGGIDWVVDPFADLYLEEVIGVLADGGRYVTCGVLDQVTAALDPDVNGGRRIGARTFEQMILRNITVMGNCLGSTDDLRLALAEHAAGRFEPLVDSTFSGHEAAAFVRRNFATDDRLGRVVYRYEGT